MEDRQLTPVNRTAPLPPCLPREVEWPTVVVAATIWLGLVVVMATHRSVPWWVTVPALMYLAGWYASLQHEVAHGHPTPWAWVNVAVAGAPLGFVYPYARFRDLHLAHHRDPDRLTEPGIDTESRYCSPEEWQRAGRLRRVLLRADRTLAGWLTVGVVSGSIRYIAQDLRRAGRDRRLGDIWVRHLISCALVGYLIVGVVGLPVLQLVVGLVYGRMVCTGLRTFAEHRWVAAGTRTAVVHASPLMALLFLNNNLHYTHHDRPGAPWYRLPGLHRELGADALAAAGAGLYTGGYLEQWRRFGFRPFCQPVHPAIESGRRIG
ncbi:MAG: fatty acid desaturase [Acidimicrobiia bacterium]|nr:fatty acid desaturase [Acidimicrobiia bacterium]